MTLPRLFNDKQFYRSLFTLAIPIMLQNLLNSLVNLIDTIMVGRLGTVELAAVGLGNQIFFLYNIFLFGICSGGAVFAAQFWGGGDIPGIRKNLGFCLTLNVATGIVFTLVTLIFPEKVIGIYSSDEAVIKAGAAYLRVLSFSFIPFAFDLAFTLSLRSVEKVRLAIVATVIALFVNGILNYLLIFGIGPFPAMGVVGAAVGTVFSRLVEALIIVVMSYVLKYVPAGTLRELFHFKRSFVRQFFRITLPVITNEVLWSTGITIQNIIFARTHTDAVAAFNIVGTVQMLTWVLFLGLGNGVAVLIGKKIGEHDENTARDYAARIIRFGPLLSVGAAMVLYPISWLLPLVFNVNPGTLQAASQMFIILCCTYPFRAFNMAMIIGICRAGGDTVFCAVYDLAVMWLVSLPLAAVAAFVMGAPVWVIYICVTMEEPLKVILGLWRFKTGKWLHNVTAGLQSGGQ